MFKSANILPNASIFGLIEVIPKKFGGRTSVCLQRSNAFAESDERQIQVLTLSPHHGVDPDAVTQRLRAEGRIGDRVTIRNVWADLRAASDADLRAIVNRATPADPVQQNDLLPYTGNLDDQRVSDTGAVLQTDRFRLDGTHLTSMRTNPPDGTKKPKGITLFDHNGHAIGHWAHEYELYFAWLDWLMQGEPAVLINDAPRLARYLHKYRRPNVTLVQTIHSRHSTQPESPAGTLSVNYLPTLKNMDRFDRVVVLTEAQRADLLDRNLAVDNVSVLPNMVTQQRVRKLQPRTRASGVMLARSLRIKRIDHAIRAVHLARTAGSAASLDVYGDKGEAEPFLIEFISELGVGKSVILRGYQVDAKKKFHSSSFSLLTSRYEGQGLVLLESMAAGCIPIAYDIKYGPSDIITDGVDGFLVPDGDTAAMAGRIQTLEAMSQHDVLKMRTAAIERAKDFGPEKIVRLWGDMMAHSLETAVAPKSVHGDAFLSRTELNCNSVQMEVAIRGDAGHEPYWALLAWTQRHGRGYGRIPAQVLREGSSTIIRAAISIHDFAAVKEGVIDFWVDLRVGGSPCRLRVKGVEEDLSLRLSRLELYATKFNSLSMRISQGEV